MSILYITNNDGTDTRIKKELTSLAKEHSIIFIGNGSKKVENTEVFELCQKVYLLKEKRNSVQSFFKSFFLVLSLLIKNKINSVHVINEQLMIFFYPLLFFKHTVLDIFDSFFLKMNYTHNKLTYIKRIVYLPINKILVTDENRYNLMPDFVKKRTLVVENFPFKFTNDVERNPDPNVLSIFYSGTLNSARGTIQMQELCTRFLDRVKVYLAGWISDEETEKLCKFPNAEYLGVIPQEKALEFAIAKCDYILCLYAPTNSNNINASPNKIFDGIQCNVPVIINSEVKVSDFVAKNKLGYILSSFNDIEYSNFVEDLIKEKSKYHFSDEIREKYTWENIENRLISAHETNNTRP
jgi:hypothetical protein